MAGIVRRNYCDSVMSIMRSGALVLLFLTMARERLFRRGSSVLIAFLFVFVWG